MPTQAPASRSGRWRAARRWASVRWWLLPLGLVLSVTLVHLGQGDFRTDTGRYAAVGLQMWRDGPLLSPHLQPDRPYFNKPPLALWIHGAVLHAAGPGLAWARLPSVVACAGCVLLTIFTVRRFHGRHVALTVGVVLALTYEFFRRTREISLDMWQLLFLLAALWCAARAVTARPRDWCWMLLLGVPLGLALLVKPLMALVLLPAVAVWLGVIGRWRLLGWLGLGGVVAVAVAGPWHAYMAVEHGRAFIDQYFGKEVGGRAGGAIATKPWWYYLAEMARTYWPWGLFFALGIVTLVRGRGLGRDDRGIWLALIWGAGWFALLSLFPDKRPRYALVVYPALAWVAGAQLAVRGAGRWRRPVRRALPWGVAALGVGALVLSTLPVRLQRPPDPGWAALFAYLDEHPDRPVVARGLDTNEQGRWYLAGRGWPGWVGGRAYPTWQDVPGDALLVHAVESGWTPPAGQRVVLDVGRVRVTEFAGGG